MPLLTIGQTLVGRTAKWILYLGACLTEMEALHFTLTHRDETIKLTRETIHTKLDDPRPAYAYDYAIKYGMIDPPSACQ
jgi:hypothetical protein